jgi:hypothetical protein
MCPSNKLADHPSEAHRRPVERNRWIYDLYYCGDCGDHVPVFRDLCPPEQAIVDAWLDQRPDYPLVAAETGMPDGLAKSSIVHGGKAPTSRGRWTSARCPTCDRWLRNPSAKQCFHCGADWH